MSKIHAVLWDNDGVLVDSEVVFFEVTRLVFKNMGLDLTSEIWRTQYLAKGNGSWDIAKALGANPTEISTAIDERNKQYQIALNNPPIIQPCVQETLMALSGHVKMGIVTGCKREQLHLMHDHNGLLEFFDIIITADDYSKSKPNPDPYLTAIDSLGLNAINCIAVEDSQRGLMSAIAANIACIVVPTELTATQDFSGAVSVEHNVSAILKYIDNE